MSLILINYIFLKGRIWFYHKKLSKEFIGFECMASDQRVVCCSDFKEFEDSIGE